MLSPPSPSISIYFGRRDSRLTLRNARFRDQIATLAAAISEVPKEEIEGEDVRQQRRTRRIVRAVIAALSVLVLLASALAVLFHGERQTAIQQRQEAITERDIAISGELVSDSEATGDSDATVSQLESIAAWGIYPSPQSYYAMLTAAASPEIATLTGGSRAVSSVAFSPDGKTLATGDLDGMAKVWNLATGQQIRSLANGHDLIFPQRAQSIFSVAFSPDGKTLATGDGRRHAALWNPATSRTRPWQRGDDCEPGHWPPDGPSAVQVLSVAFSPDSKTLATGDDDGTARLWNLATGQQIRSLATGSDGVWSVAFSPDGKTLATGDDDGTAQLWNVSYLVDVLTRLCSQVGGSLTQAEWTRYVPPGPAYRNVCAQHS